MPNLEYLMAEQLVNKEKGKALYTVLDMRYAYDMDKCHCMDKQQNIATFKSYVGNPPARIGL